MSNILNDAMRTSVHIYYYYIFHFFSPINGCLVRVRVKHFLYFSSIFIIYY